MKRYTYQERIEVFWSRVKKGNPLQCWEWQGGKHSFGYGVFSIDRKLIYTHVFSYELENGTVPKGLCVLHECDNPPCVNPAHLFTGTIIDNNKDMLLKGRTAKGTKNGKSLLTYQESQLIRSLYIRENVTQEELGRVFGVCRATVQAVIAGRTWRSEND